MMNTARLKPMRRFVRVCATLAISGALLLLLHAAPVVQADEDRCILYAVRSGDSIANVASSHGLTVDELLDANPAFARATPLVRGTELCIPLPSAEAERSAPSEAAATVKTLEPDVPESIAYSGQLLLEMEIDPCLFGETATDRTLTFTGGNGAVHLPDGLASHENGTVAHWVKRSQKSNRGVLFYTADANVEKPDAQYDGWGDPADLLEIHTAVDDAGVPYFLYQNGPGEELIALQGQRSLEAGRWHHIAATYQTDLVTEIVVTTATIPTTTTLTVRQIEAALYVDGLIEARGQVRLPLSSRQTAVTLVGRPAASDASDRVFQGEFDKMQIWDRALAEPEVSELAEGGLSRDVPGLIGHWHFNECSGTTVHNQRSDVGAGRIDDDVQRVVSTRTSEDGAGQSHLSSALTEDAILQALSDARSLGVFDPAVFPNLTWITTRSDRDAAISALEALDAAEFTRRFEGSERLVLFRTTANDLEYDFVRETEIAPALFLVESYRLTSFLGDYGTGRILNTFSLLPDEETSIIINTYKERSAEQATTSSILDSFTKASARQFEEAVATERGSQSAASSSLAWNVAAKGEARWGWGSAEASAGASGTSNAVREDFSRNVTNAVAKQAAQASASRNIEISTSERAIETEGSQESVSRTIANANGSRTLNFVFYQMNQEYVTLLHLVDVRVGYFDGVRSQVVPLSQLDGLLQDAIPESGAREEVHDLILSELHAIYDYADRPISDFVTCQPLVNVREARSSEQSEYECDGYWRVNTELESNYADNGAGGSALSVPGIIVSAEKIVLRTDGVYVDALLGESNAWDAYNQALRDEEVRRAVLENNELERRLR